MYSIQKDLLMYVYIIVCITFNEQGKTQNRLWYIGFSSSTIFMTLVGTGSKPVVAVESHGSTPSSKVLDSLQNITCSKFLYSKHY